MITDFKALVTAAEKKGKMNVVLAVSEDLESLEALAIAHKEGLAEPVFVGDKSRTHELCKGIGFDISEFKLYDEPNPVKAVQRAVDVVREGQASALMKGLVDTGKLLRAVLDKEKGLKAFELLTHVMLVGLPTYPKIMLISDVAMVIRPDLEQKIKIIQNALTVAKVLGIDKPRVAMLCATEKVNYEHMPETVDAAILSKMAERGQLGSLILDGPMALDLAVNPESCRIKKFISPVGGEADILIVPEIVAGNVFYKAFTQFMPEHKSAGVIMGAKCPVILLSRSDSADCKFYSIALANLLS
jgi:phosphate butyryltransferase